MTANAALLLLCLTGGYVFAVTWHPSLYRSARESSQRIYFRSVFYAFFSIVFAAELLAPFYLSGYLDTFLQIQSVKYDAPLLSHIKHLLECEPFVSLLLVTSFLVGIFLPVILNLFFAGVSAVLPGFNFDLYLVKRAIRKNDFERLLFRSATRQTPVLLTLLPGKIYLGWVVDAPNPSAERRSIRILPLLSGYRDPDDHRVKFTTSYHDILSSVDDDSEVLGHLESRDFEVVLPVEQIYSAHLFDLEAYTHFQTPVAGPPRPPS